VSREDTSGFGECVSIAITMRAITLSGSVEWKSLVTGNPAAASVIAQPQPLSAQQHIIPPLRSKLSKVR
jgi:hypothetical protein